MKTRTRFTVISLIVAVAIAIGVLYFAARGFSAHPTSGQHLAQVDWLPSSASDISFYDNGDPLFQMYCYECTMPHESVIRFAKEKEWQLREKSPVVLPGRVWFYLSKGKKIKESATDDTYASALEYHTEQSNGGGIKVVYHQPSSRLFVYYTAN